MLVLSRKCDAEIYIGPDITIKVLEIHKRQVKLGIEAPSRFSVLRGELPPIPDRGEPSVEHRALVVSGKLIPMLNLLNANHRRGEKGREDLIEYNNRHRVCLQGGQAAAARYDQYRGCH